MFTRTSRTCRRRCSTWTTSCCCRTWRVQRTRRARRWPNSSPATWRPSSRPAACRWPFLPMPEESMMNRSQFVRALAAALFVLGAGAAQADAWPAKPVTILVPFAAGGGTDIGTRIVAQKLSQLWGQSVLVDNRGGAGGNVGLDVVARAKPDGYTLLAGNV